jgi:hypothetical protein
MDKIVIICSIIIILLGSVLVLGIYEKPALTINSVDVIDYNGYKALKVSLCNSDNDYKRVQLIGDNITINYDRKTNTQINYIKSDINNDILYVCPVYLYPGNYVFSVENSIMKSEKEFIFL